MSPRARALYEHADTNATARRHAAGRLWLYNVGIGCLLGTNYLFHVPEEEPRAWLFALPALVSSVVFLTLAPGGLLVVAAHLLRRARLLGWVQGAVWTVFHVLLYTDTRIYNIFRYHFNGQVLNLIYTRGSEDSIHLGWQVWTAVSLGLLGVGSIQAFLWRRALAQAVADQNAPAPPRRLLRPAVVWMAVLVPAIFVEKTIYAQADLARDQQVKVLSRIFPLYPALPVEEVASSLLGRDIDGSPPLILEGVELDYPLTRPEVDPEGPRPNILLLVIDCLRHDMIDHEGPEGIPATPNIDAFAAEGVRRFEDHVSGGNSTRYGLFSMIYGLHGSYWFPMLNEGVSPVLVDTLLDLGYEPGIFSTASQNYPELRATAWSRIPDAVHDDFPSFEAWKRDEESTAALNDWLRERATEEAPFFGFLLLDAPHQTYSYPPDSAPFPGAAEELDYLAMTANEGPDLATLFSVVNRYKNAVHHADRCVGEVLATLDETGLADDTIVIVTGDHGEEFRECGFFGHTSAFTPQQVRVPFLVRGPGIEPGIEERPTSHLDVPATLLELLGADPTARDAWTLGGNFLHPDPERRRVMGGWNELGMWTPDAIVRIRLGTLSFDLEVYDYAWHLQLEDREVLEREAEALSQLAWECNRFLR